MITTKGHSIFSVLRDNICPQVLVKSPLLFFFKSLDYSRYLQNGRAFFHVCSCVVKQAFFGKARELMTQAFVGRRIVSDDYYAITTSDNDLPISLICHIYVNGSPTVPTGHHSSCAKTVYL